MSEWAVPDRHDVTQLVEESAKLVVATVDVADDVERPLLAHAA